MRLWHKDIISKLPNRQLLGQHRECCALRGKGWGKKHSVVDYVFKHPYRMLYDYHRKVMDEMCVRGYTVSEEWKNPAYRGKAMGYDASGFTDAPRHGQDYAEHDDAYLNECLDNLKSKNIIL